MSDMQQFEILPPADLWVKFLGGQMCKRIMRSDVLTDKVEILPTLEEICKKLP